MSKLRVKPIDVTAPGSFKMRSQILKALQDIRSGEVDYVAGQLLLDELLLPRLETTDGSDLEEAIAQLSASDADQMMTQLLSAEVPTQSAES